MPLLIPLQALPSQTLNIVLNNQVCTINVYQKFFGLFLDLFVSIAGTLQPIVQGVICQDGNFVVRSSYLGFVGDLHFHDEFGPSMTTMEMAGGNGASPDFEGLGNPLTSRFVLVYHFPAELPDDYGQGPFDPDVLAGSEDFLLAFPNATIDPPGGGSQMLNWGSMR
jgi:hypothetical protein